MSAPPRPNHSSHLLHASGEPVPETVQGLYLNELITSSSQCPSEAGVCGSPISQLKEPSAETLEFPAAGRAGSVAIYRFVGV